MTKRESFQLFEEKKVRAVWNERFEIITICHYQ